MQLINTGTTTLNYKTNKCVGTTCSNATIIICSDNSRICNFIQHYQFFLPCGFFLATTILKVHPSTANMSRLTSIISQYTSKSVNSYKKVYVCHKSVIIHCSRPPHRVMLDTRFICSMSARTHPRKVKASNVLGLPPSGGLKLLHKTSAWVFLISQVYFSTSMFKWRYQGETKQKHNQWITLVKRIKGIHNSIVLNLLSKNA